MSGAVSYELFSARVGSASSGFTPDGGIYETFLNNTGTDSVKGTIVVASTTTNNAVDIAPIGSMMPIGVIYESTVPNGLPVKVVVYGKAEVLLEDSQSATTGYWCSVSNTVAGRMIQESSEPTDTNHNREIGHSLQTVDSGTDVLALIQLHFN